MHFLFSRFLCSVFALIHKSVSHICRRRKDAIDILLQLPPHFLWPTEGKNSGLANSASASLLFCFWIDHLMTDFWAYFVWEALEGGSARAALLRGLKAADDVLESCCHNKIFLLQTKFFSLKELQQTHKETVKSESYLEGTSYHSIRVSNTAE